MTVPLAQPHVLRCRAGAWSLLLVALAAFAAVGLSGAPGAEAHAVLRSTSPAAGASLGAAPQEVVLTFDEPPAAVGSVVRVTGSGGVVSTGPARVVGPTVHQSLAAGLDGGAYRVDWRVTSDDGHPVSDSFAFTVATPAMSTRTTPASASPSSASATASASPSSRVKPPSGTARPWATVSVGALAVLAAVALALFIRHLIARKSG